MVLGVLQRLPWRGEISAFAVSQAHIIGANARRSRPWACNPAEPIAKELGALFGSTLRYQVGVELA